MCIFIIWVSPWFYYFLCLFDVYWLVNNGTWDHRGSGWCFLTPENIHPILWQTKRLRSSKKNWAEACLHTINNSLLWFTHIPGMQISRGPKWDQEYWGTFYSWQGAELQVWTNGAALSRAIGMGLSIPGENIVSFFNILYINLGEQVLFYTSLGKVIQHKVNSTFSFHKKI